VGYVLAFGRSASHRFRHHEVRLEPRAGAYQSLEWTVNGGRFRRARAIDAIPNFHALR